MTDTAISPIIFYSLATLAVVTAIMVVTGRNLFHAAMFLGAFLMGIAGFYFLLDADFVGIMQVFVYVGGVVVVLLFGIMLTSQMTNVRLVSGFMRKGSTMIAIVALVGLLTSVFKKASFYVSSAEPAKDTISLVGELFMTDYVLPFEVISILLLVAVIGAIIVAREEGRS